MTKDWKEYWASRPQAEGGEIEKALAQVGKTRFGKPVPPEQVTLLVEHVAKTLKLSRDMKGMDLGCGNGLLTHALSPRIGQVTGFDYSPALLETAHKHFNAPNISYHLADLTKMDQQEVAGGSVDVAWSIEVVQNLDNFSFSQLLCWIEKALKPGGCFLASGIPERESIRNFYDTEARWQLHLENERNGREQMGRWWCRQDLGEAAQQAGLSIEFVALPVEFYTAHYRVDALFTKAAP